MRQSYFGLLCMALCLSVSPLSAKKLVPAFPGAEGFGRYVSGGRGGVVYHVTSLDDNPSNPQAGTFRYAVNQTGARTIVFDVAGTIHLKAGLSIRNGDLTIAGQTSPGGICIGDYPFSIGAQNVIVRYIRVRPGDICGTECDGFGGFDGGNFIIDHCSVSWSVDEVISVYANQNTTVQWCIASQPLNYSVHPKTLYYDGKPHGYGGVWGGDHASFHHNLIAHATSRTPRFGSRYTMAERGLTDLTDCRNNVFYNWSGVGCYGGSNMQINMVNNYIKPGPATDAVYSGKSQHGRIFAADADVLGIYATGNYVDGHSDISADNWTQGIAAQMDATTAQKTAARRSEPYEDGGVVTFTAAEAYSQVLNYVGASNYRDRYDSMIVADVRQRKASYTSYTKAYSYTGTDYDGRNEYTVSRAAGWLNPGNINSQNDVILPGETSPWVTIPVDASRNMTDTDGDGIPDEWEYRMDLDPNDPKDALQTDSVGYTMLEVYLNRLVEKLTAAPYGELEVPGTRPEIIESGYTRTDATVSWKLGTAACSGSGQESPAGSFASTSAGYSGFSLGTKTVGGTTFTTFTTASALSAARSLSNAAVFSLEAPEGYEFTPSLVSFEAIRCGTNGGNIDVVWETADGQSAEVCTGKNPNRDNSGSGSVCSFDLSEESFPASAGTGKMVFYMGSLGAGKSLGLAKVQIGGQLNALDALPPRACGQANAVLSVEYFDMAGRPLSCPRGLCLRRIRLADGSVRVEKLSMSL